MNIQDRINNAQRLATDEEYMKSFIIGLHEYQKANMRSRGNGHRRWECGYDRMYEDADKVYRYFIKFCIQQEIAWFTAHNIFWDKYGAFYCDCDYLYNLQVTDKGIEVVGEPHFLNRNS